MLDLMYITNRPEVALLAEAAGADLIFVDMEFIGKDARQGGMDTVQNHHTHDDIRNIKSVLTRAKLLVRVNPIHDDFADYMSSEEEIDLAIEAGADIIMLPFFKSVEEVETFLKILRGRAKCCLLLETPEAVSIIDDVLKLDGIDMIHIGLNDLHLALGKKFMFELLADGTVDYLSDKFKSKGVKFGFGGIATLTKGAIPGKMILTEHYRLGSSMVILGRSFCNASLYANADEVATIFNNGIAEIRSFESTVAHMNAEYFLINQRELVSKVRQIVETC